MQLTLSRLVLTTFILLAAAVNFAQDAQLQTQLKVKQLVDKKAEYHRLTHGELDGYRIKIHFGGDSDKAKAVSAKFAARFPEYTIHEDYQLPYFVVLIGDFKTVLEAFETKKKVEEEFPTAFIVKVKIRPR